MALSTQFWTKDLLKKVVDKTVVNQQDNDYKGVKFQFAIDDDGNYGYIKDGADTVTPFSNIESYYIKIYNSLDNLKFSNTVGDTFNCNGRYFTRTSSEPMIVGKKHSDYTGYILFSLSSTAFSGTYNDHGQITDPEEYTDLEGHTIYISFMSQSWSGDLDISLTLNGVSEKISNSCCNNPTDYTNDKALYTMIYYVLNNLSK